MIATAPNFTPQTATHSTGTVTSAGHQQPRRAPQRLDGSRGSGRSTAELEEEIGLGRKVLRNAGVQQAEVHARRLVELRELGEADYAPASVVWQGSVAAAREQFDLLRERQIRIRELRATLAQRSTVEVPRVGNFDALWARQARRQDPDRFAPLDRDVAEAKRNLAAAREAGADKRTLVGLQTAVDVTEHQVRRAELATRRGETWEKFRQVQALAQPMLTELKRLEDSVLAEHEASLTTALEGSNTRPERVHQAAPEPDHLRAAPSPAL